MAAFTIEDRLLTNGAYGFPKGQKRRVKPVALACIHITGNLSTSRMTDRAGAMAERNYANRAGSGGPSAHLYVARSGLYAVRAVSQAYAAWSNGDVSSPNTGNPGIRRVLALRAKGYNANEAYWVEFENVGHPSGYRVTDGQQRLNAEVIRRRAELSGLDINRETVHGHWEINGIDRQNCPDKEHEAFLREVIAYARDMPTPAPTPGGDEDMNSYAVPKAPANAVVRLGANLYTTTELKPGTVVDGRQNIENVSPGPRRMPFHGQVLPGVKAVEYVNASGVHTGFVYFVRDADVSGIEAITIPPSAAQLDAAGDAGYAAGVKAVKAAAAAVSEVRP